MNIVAFDLGLSCGWACGGAGGVPRFGTEKLVRDRHESDGLRYLRFERLLDELLLLTYDLVVYEQVRRHKGTRAAHVYGALHGVLASCCEADGISKAVTYEGLEVADIKRHATGKGNASKDMMWAAAQRKWPGLKIETEHEADALWIWDLAQSKWKKRG